MALLDLLDVANRLNIEPDPELAGVIERVLRPFSEYYFRTEVVGYENIPEEGALLVGNHGLYGYDAAFFVFKLFRISGKMTRVLVDHSFFKIPVLRQAMALAGFVDGNKDNAVKLLQDGELMMVFPGGAKEALWKSQDSLYRLHWEKSLGFIEVALRSGRPLVPVAGVGPDDAFIILADSEQLLNSPAGQIVDVIAGHPKYMPPIALGPGFLPIPIPVQFTYYVGKPMYLDYPPEAAEDIQLMKKIKTNFKRRLQRLIDKGLKLRDESYDSSS